jgi:hypothetical protein
MKIHVKLIVVLSGLLLCSCVSFRHIREEIKEANPEVKEVGIIKNWGYESKVFAVDILFHDEKRLFLTFFRSSVIDIGRIGGYCFNTYFQYSGSSGFVSWGLIPAYVVAEAMGKPFKTGKPADVITDVIRRYDELYAFTLSLPCINDEAVQAEKEKCMIQASRWFGWVWVSDMEFREIRTENRVTSVVFRDNWGEYYNNKYFGSGQPEY